MVIFQTATSSSHQAWPSSSAANDGNDGWWGLMYQGWVLITPDGKRLRLTATERACFLCLLASPRRELTREALARALPQSNLRAINVSISRLRKKARAMNVVLPLHTVHGMGYVFLGNLTADSVSPEMECNA